MVYVKIHNFYVNITSSYVFIVILLNNSQIYMEFLAKIQRNGIIVIPKNIRELYNVDVGDMVKLNFVEKTEKFAKVST